MNLLFKLLLDIVAVDGDLLFFHLGDVEGDVLQELLENGVESSGSDVLGLLVHQECHLGDHILFIGAGAFHTAKPTDLIPELQGRFPIRVELENLDKDTFVKILTVPENALLKQHKALLETEGIEIEFTDEAVDEIAEMAFLMNEQTENIGARRLHTILERLLEDISFNIPDMDTEKIVIDQAYVKEIFAEKIHPEDIDKYIL